MRIKQPNRQFRTFTSTLAVVVGMTMFIVSCAAPDTSSPSASESVAATPPPEPQQLTVVMGIPFQSANDIITVVLPQELGYFEEEGVAPDFQFTTGAANDQLLVAGQADIGFATVSDIVVARSLGTPVKAFYNILTNNATAVAVLEDSGITAVDQLQGKTIGVAGVGFGRYYDGRAMVTAAGLDPDADISWVSVGIGAQALNALQSDEVQALVLWDAAYADMENLGVDLRLFTFPFQETLMSIVWEATDQFIEDNHDAIVGFGRAQAKAYLFAMTNPEAAVRIYLDAHPDLVPAGTSPEKAFSDALHILEANLRDGQTMAGAVGGGGFAPAAWQTAVDYYTDLGLVETPITDVSALHISDDLIMEMNDFDHDAVTTQATNYPTQ